jgi:hypothetical protein
MTTSDSGRMVRCPTCMDEFHWIDTGAVWLYDDTKRQYEPIDISNLKPVKQAATRRDGYYLCPNPSGDAPEHYLPASYATYDDPLVVGLIGAPESGKTHLLTAMIRAAHAGGLAPYELTVSALDFLRHQEFHSKFIDRFEKGLQLPGTESNVLEYADGLLLRGASGLVRPVTFFDVAGEDLQRADSTGRGGRFLIGASAFIFVYSTEDPLDLEERIKVKQNSLMQSGNRAFTLALERIRAVRTNAESAAIPAAIALTKADRLRYVTPADKWLRRGTEAELDASLIHAESHDVYAYLHQQGAAVSLAPFEVFSRCTLHFVSASGGDVSVGKSEFPRGVRPMRIIQPLVAILAMAGVITGPEAEKVGF